MKKHLLSLVITGTVLFLGCKKNNDNSTSQLYTARGFTVSFDGKTYIGIDSADIRTGYTQYKGQSLDYNNLVSAVLVSDINFSLKIANVPDSGIVKNLCSSACVSKNGDAIVTYTDGDGNNLTDFSGTVTGISSGEVQINASKNGKVLTAKLKWK
jgi:hypothetical protein